MFAGHAFLAFALVGAVAARFSDRETALRLGLLAAAFAAIPDVDMSYALVGLLGAEGGVLAYAGAFWHTSTLVHRSITHSLVVAPFVAALAAAWVAGRRSETRWLLAGAVAVGGSLVAVALLVTGFLGAFVMGVFVVAALAVAELIASRGDTSPRATFLVGLVGLVSHPFGDLFTGKPPALFYPLDVTLLAERVMLSTDPTLHLLGAFAIELVAIWAGLVVATQLLGHSPREAVYPRAATGFGYAAAVLFIPAPTLDLSYPFVFSILLVGAVGIVPQLRLFERRLEHPGALDALLTGLAAVTVAGLAYALAYVFVF